MDIEPHYIELIGRYAGAGFALGLGGVGAAIGMGLSAGAADHGIMRQPQVHSTMLRTMLIGQAVGGSPSIFALVVGLLLLFVPALDLEHIGGNYVAMLLGAGLSVGFGCFGSGFGCGVPGAAACDGVARNPSRSSQVTSVMIIGQAVAQSPAIFSTVIALILIFFYQHPGTDWSVIGICIGSGLAMGLGALGPGWGSGMTAGGAMAGIGRWPRSHGLTVRTMLVAQGVCETPAIFGMLVAFIMLFAMQGLQNDIVGFAKAVGAGVAVGLGGIGPGIGSGIAGKSGCEATAFRPRVEGLIMRTMLIGQAVSQSTAIYALIIALALLYVV